MTECWLESGLVTVIGRPSGSPSPATAMSPAGGNRSTIDGATSARVTASVTPAPTSVSRRASRSRSGSGRYDGIGVSGRTSGMVS